jgi:hypothetical protein
MKGGLGRGEGRGVGLYMIELVYGKEGYISLEHDSVFNERPLKRSSSKLST